MKEFPSEFEIDGRRFIREGTGYRHVFREFRIHIDGIRDGLDGIRWMGRFVTAGGRHCGLTPVFGTPEDAARDALELWAEDIKASDEADAQDSERDRQDYERDNRLRKDDVL